MTVAVIAPADDVSADRVIVELRRRLVTVHRIDPADVPKLLTVTAALGEEGWAGVVKGPYRATSLRDVRAVYCRQPVVPRIGPLLDALDVRWVDHPEAVDAASQPPRQFAAAVKAGLATPDCLLATEPDVGRAFIEASPSGVLCQALAGSHWTAPTPMTATQVVEEVCFYRRVVRGRRMRAVVVDRRVFAAAAMASGERFDTVELPPGAADRLASVVAELGLTVAVVDLVDTGSEVVFAGLDPSGSWVWCEEECAAPVASLLADALLR